MKIKWTSAMFEQLRELRKKQYTYSEVAKEMGLERNQVINKCRKHGFTSKREDKVNLTEGKLRELINEGRTRNYIVNRYNVTRDKLANMIIKAGIKTKSTKGAANDKSITKLNFSKITNKEFLQVWKQFKDLKTIKKELAKYGIGGWRVEQLHRELVLKERRRASYSCDEYSVSGYVRK